MRSQTTPKITFTFDWLFDAPRDIVLMFLPAVFGVALYFVCVHLSQTQALSVLALQGFGLGALHQSATWWHFLDSRNRGVYLNRANILWSVILPVALMAFCYCSYRFYPPAVSFVYLLWTVQHVSKQNTGFLLLYRRAGANTALGNEKMALQSVHSAAAFFCFLMLMKLLPQGSLMSPVLVIVLLFTFVEATVSTFRYLIGIYSEIKCGSPFNVPATSFWAVSLFFFAPFAAPCNNWLALLLIPLVMHWFQYLGLNAIIARNKYTQESNLSGILLQRPFLVFSAFSACFVLLLLSLALLPSIMPMSNSSIVLNSLFMSFALAHYLHDAFIWRFRESFNREALLAYISKPVPVVPKRVLVESR